MIFKLTPTTDEELHEALRLTIMMQESGIDAPDFVAGLKSALQTQAARKAREARIAELWEYAGAMEHERVQ